MTVNKLINVNALIVLMLGSAVPSASFQRQVSTTISQMSSISPSRAKPPSTTPLRLSPTDLIPDPSFADPSFLGGSLLWGLNFYYGFDWILAPLGTNLDSDFNPAYRTATFLGNVLAGRPLEAAVKEAAGSILVDDGERPEMGSRIGSGANAGFAAAGAVAGDDEAAVEDGPSDWLSDRAAGLRSSAPLPLRLAVVLIYGIVGALAMTIAGSFQTAAVLAVPALVYEIGRPSLPTREEAILDAKLDEAVAKFAEEQMLMYGQEFLPEGVAPVRRDEATNERELVGVFRKGLRGLDAALLDRDVSDFQIEMRMREYGTGRTEAGYIKGVRLLREPVPWQ